MGFLASSFMQLASELPTNLLLWIEGPSEQHETLQKKGLLLTQGGVRIQCSECYKLTVLTEKYSFRRIP